MRISINALHSTAELIKNDQLIADRVLRIEELFCAADEQKIASLPVEQLRLNCRPFSNAADTAFFTQKIAPIRNGRPELNAIAKAWEFPFKGATFQRDLELLCSFALSGRMRIRDLPALAVNLEHGTVGHRYPDHTEISAGLRRLEQLTYTDRNKTGASITAGLAWMFFLRLHPFPNGNGRTSRAFINIVYREQIGLQRPVFSLGPVVYANLDVLVDAVFRTQDVAASIACIQEVLLRYCLRLDEIHRGRF